MTVIAAWTDVPTEVADVPNNVYPRSVRPWFHILQLTGLLPASTSRSSSWFKSVKVALFHLIGLIFLALHLLALALYRFPQAARVYSINSSDRRVTLQPLLLVHNDILSAVCIVIMFLRGKRIVREVRQIGRISNALQTTRRRIVWTCLTVLFLTAVVAVFVTEFYYGLLMPEPVKHTSDFVQQAWNFSMSESDHVTLSWVMSVACAVNNLSVRVLQFVLAMVMLQTAGGFSRLAEKMTTAGSKTDTAAAIVCLKTHAALSRTVRLLDGSVSILTLALYLDDIVWIMALIERWHFGGVPPGGLAGVESGCGPGCEGLFLLSMSLLLLLSWTCICLSDKVMSGLLLYALFTRQFGENPLEPNRFRSEMASLLANFNITVNCRFKES
ncbi:hypothetical protein BV898_09283 [Hypsibius exemplaris]|uniref:Uncharacterized protein n=1 Tax=Hypsibius exemplaris TaxID=2072580 RepID=A0A1W0WNB6_HYPEX|nr:hypothetical protein BV898_09283 [Hypsibius exemplaris]